MVQIGDNNEATLYFQSGFNADVQICYRLSNGTITTQQIALKSDLEPLFCLKVVKNTITYNNLFYRLQQIIIQGTGIDTYTVEIQAFVDGVFCNRLHVGGGVQEFWTPETNVVIQYGYNDESLCPHNINIVACKINWDS